MKDNFTQHGFETLSVDPLGEYQANGIHLRHSHSGAEIYKIDTEDEENLFAFTFRTPPSDHTGVPHILEHAVLCGSQNYPLKDPFLVLLKGSAHTFLNAMTYPDKTVYPASSMVKADFFNLLRVYGDAVFFPQLKEEAFEQEGHRLNFDSKGHLVRSGIVLNEMKGSYSSVESLAGDYSLRSIFPDTPYQWDSGGDPEHIPNLSYKQFREFHNTFYHPSNARIFLYGNHSLDELLPMLDCEFLSRFDKKPPSSPIPLQKIWEKPRKLWQHWPSQPSESIENKSTISINWLWGDTTNTHQFLEAQVLSHILLGHSGAILQKALIDSHLGEDISPVSGLETSLRQMVFSVAIRGSNFGQEVAMENLVLDTLEKSTKGLNKQLIEGAMRSIEFRAREIRGGIPFGLRLLKRALRAWLHDKAPRDSLAFTQPMSELRSRVKKGYFEHCIRRDILNNTHRSTVLVSPDPHLEERRNREERKQLDKIQESLSPEKKIQMKHAEERLKKFQEVPDSPEILAKIPFLSPSDLPKKVIKIPLESGKSGSVSWYSNATFCNGISYLHMAFNLHAVEPSLQPWLPLFGRALTEVGLPGLSHEEVAVSLAMNTGGLGCSLEASAIHENIGGGISLRLFLHLKALTNQWDEALDITQRLLLSADFNNEERINDLLIELRNDYRSALVPSGHAFASMRASAKHSLAASWEDLWYGTGQLLFLQSLVDKPNRAKIAVDALKSIREQVIRQRNTCISVSSDSEHISSVLQKSLQMSSSLPQGSSSVHNAPELFQHETLAESLVTSSAVSFSALSLPGSVIGSPQHAYAVLLAHILRTGFLWETIRMKGGAYGASASVSSLDGVFTFSTYRDPFIAPSLEAFHQSLEWGQNLDDSTVKMAIIGVIGKSLKMLSPGEQGLIALKRKLYGVEDSMRQNCRDLQLSAKISDIQNVANVLLNLWEKRSISVIAGEKHLSDAINTIPYLGESKIFLP